MTFSIVLRNYIYILGKWPYINILKAKITYETRKKSFMLYHINVDFPFEFRENNL